MSKRLGWLIICLLLTCCVYGAGHLAADGGMAKMVIVYRKVAQPQNQLYDHVFRCYNTPDQAAEELAWHLKEMTGADFRIVEESQWKPEQPAFLIGRTAFAEKNGIDFSSFQKEEWFYGSIGPHLVLGGGWNWGDSLAVSKFLEEELGCHWFSFESIWIPRKSRLEIRRLKRRGAPSFAGRVIFIPPTGQKSLILRDRLYLWLRRNRSNFQREVLPNSNQYTTIHSFYEFVDPDLYFKDHPEYFSMNEHGRRAAGTRKSRSGGQLCLSNPKVAEITEKKLREFIAADRKKLPKEKWPLKYDISQCDATNYICLCPQCRKITEKEGSEAGLLFHFLNPIARNIARDFPELRIQTFVYVSTEKVPRFIRPEKNICLRWCDLYFNSDCFRPLEHPVNAKQKKIFDDWCRRGIVVNSIWDYWNMGGAFIDMPRIETMVDAIAPDLRYFHDRGVQYYFTESEHQYYRVDTNFHDLQVWLGLQLLDDISKNENDLIALFMKCHYGPAARPMTAALNLIRDAVRNEKRPMFYNTGSLFQKYLTRDFVVRLWHLLQEAQRMTAADSDYRIRVEREMLPVLKVQVYYNGFTVDMDKKQAVEEYRRMRIRQLKAIYAPAEMAAVTEEMERELARLEFDFPTPEKFRRLRAEDIRKFCALDFRSNQVDDPQSALKKVIRIGSKDLQKDRKIHLDPNDKNKFVFGIHNHATRQEKLLSIKHRLPTDEKYHWYCIRNFHAGPKTTFFAWGWWTICNVSKVYTDGSDNLWDVWLSLKVTGPAYVPGSVRENNILLESIIFTKPGLMPEKGEK